jgi:hypothetical protein
VNLATQCVVHAADAVQAMHRFHPGGRFHLPGCATGRTVANSLKSCRVMKQRASDVALKNIFRRNAPADTGLHRSAEVDTSAQQVEPLQPSEPEWQPLIVGTIHSPRERASLLMDEVLSAGYGGKSIYQGDLEVFHRILCERDGWAPVSWLAICRELKRLGVRKAKLSTGGERLTMYVIEAPASNVVKHPAIDRKRS